MFWWRPVTQVGVLFALTAMAPVRAADQSSEGVPNAAPFFVAPFGNDAWSGRLRDPAPGGEDGPFATLAHARDAARTAKAGNARLGQLILVREGDYFLDQTLDLSVDDSGLTLEAAPGEQPVIYGGRPIGDWRPDPNGLWSAALPPVRGNPWDFRMLVVDGRVANRSRLPREGTFAHLSTFDGTWTVGRTHGWAERPTDQQLTTLVCRPEDLGAWLDPGNAELTIYHMWNTSMVGLAAVDGPGHLLRLSNPCDYPPGAFGVSKFVVWNERAGMSDPGQWFLDRALRRAVYWPLAGQDMRKVRAVAPTIETVIRIRGSEDAPIHDVVLRGLRISMANAGLGVRPTDWTLGGFNGISQPGAVQVGWANDCTLDRLDVSQVVGQGIKASSVNRLLVRGCRLSDIGATGIVVGGDRCAILGNRVQRTGIVYAEGIGIAASGSRVTIRHNEVNDTSYDGVFANGDGLLVEKNLVYHAMQGLHDGAGIYVAGNGEGMVIRGNFVRDIVDSGGYGAAAYYLDELCTHVLVEDNLSLGVVRALNCHIGDGNLIRNNFFISPGDLELQFPRCVAQCLEHNVIWARTKISIHPFNAISRAAGNVLFSDARKVAVRVTPVLGNVPTAYDLVDAPPPASGDQWMLSDPRISEFRGGRVELAPDSPALRLGVHPIDVSDAGPDRDPGATQP